MSTLFDSDSAATDIRTPLADRMRPRRLEDVIGQTHLLGPDGPIRLFYDRREFPSILLWGPPGVGKTTLAQLIAREAGYHFTRLSAIEAGVKEVRELIAQAQFRQQQGRKSLMFIDEIHRFNKNQQDALLHAVETGVITLFGATTENPSFEVNAALLSRCQVYRLQSLTDEELGQVIDRALTADGVLKDLDIHLEDRDLLISLSAGDARTALNALELAVSFARKGSGRQVQITRSILEKALQQKTAQYDKSGENHYDTISAFIKSMRGSDPDAALFWLAKMLDAGEDPRFIARRMVIFASEDVGNADPFALSLAVTGFQAVELIGMPEGRINLAQVVTYLACCPKSNASYVAIEEALSEIRSGANATVPIFLRNAPTRLMKQEGYGDGYQYPHSFDNQFVRANYFPEKVPVKSFYRPGSHGKEKLFRERLEFFWPERYQSLKKKD
ncbi:MAG: replication-associated recombination protein A [Bacteroidetes bacterium]|nr:replication-associated recombination protein A [Bacteroidota bacterium]